MTEATQNDSISKKIAIAAQWCSQKIAIAAQWCSQNRHFLVTATALTVVWLGWVVIMAGLGLVFQKQPVEWPVGVEVDPVKFQMLSLAKSFGPNGRFEQAGDGELFFPRKGELFVTESGDILEGRKNGVLVYRDRDGQPVFNVNGKLGELKYKESGEPVLDGQPDGERIIEGEVLDSLGIGMPVDVEAVNYRKSGWYVSRTYIDRQKTSAQRYRRWQLDVTYYTGVLSKVPHVPEACLKAGGMVLSEQGNVQFDVPNAPGPWGTDPVTCQFVQYSNPKSEYDRRQIQYYVFSLNGSPEPLWEMVRLKMLSPFGKYVYFAKIQFSPGNVIKDLDEAQRATEEFVKYMLPEVLKSLPMPADMERLESGDQQVEKNSN